jgi:hypothetical protein
MGRRASPCWVSRSPRGFEAPSPTLLSAHAETKTCRAEAAGFSNLSRASARSGREGTDLPRERRQRTAAAMALTLTHHASNMGHVRGARSDQMPLSSRILLVGALLIFAAVQAPSKGASAVSVGQSNPGTADINRMIVSQPQVIQSLAPVVPTTGSVSSPLAPNTGVGGLPLTSTSSGAPAAAAATSNSGAIAPPSATASLGAMGRDMPECMAAWDNRTHITKSRWREICKRSLADLDL